MSLQQLDSSPHLALLLELVPPPQHAALTSVPLPLERVEPNSFRAPFASCLQICYLDLLALECSNHPLIECVNVCARGQTCVDAMSLPVLTLSLFKKDPQRYPPVGLGGQQEMVPLLKKETR
jgi:hypothetical protein